MNRDIESRYQTRTKAYRFLETQLALFEALLLAKRGIKCGLHYSPTTLQSFGRDTDAVCAPVLRRLFSSRLF